MRLFIMRHGPSEPTQPGKRDFDRALTPEGRELVRTNALALRDRGEAPERIYASPLVRTRQTAEVVASAFGGIDIELKEELAPSNDAISVLGEVRASRADAIMLVAHAPEVADLVTVLTGSYTGSFDAGMIVALELAGGSASRVYAIR